MPEQRRCPNGHLLSDPATTDTTQCPVCGVHIATGFDDSSDNPKASEESFDALPFVPGRLSPSPNVPFVPSAQRDAGPISVAQFSEHVLTSGLVSAHDFESLVSSSKVQFDNSIDLAERLVEAGQLTQFQADELRQPVPAPLQLGDFIITARIGRGGMGDVFRAVHATLGRVVALKVLPPEMSTRATAVERFEREAAVTSKLEHDNIVTIFEVGKDKGRHFFTMRFVDGSSLAERLNSGPIDNRSAAEFLEPIARAVAVAHQHGILHRDIKPHNILIDEASKRPLIADFGLALLTEEAGELTKSGAILGTPQYMPPEQARDAGRATTLADVYSLGATLYHALTGRPPFQAAGSMETLRQVLNDDPVPPRHLNSAVNRDLETICLKCLEKEPTARYASATALADELNRFLSGQPILARPIGKVSRLWRWCRRNPLVASLGLAAATGFIAAFVAISIGLIRVRSEYQRAERGFAQARQVVHDFLTRVSDETLLNQPGMQPLKRDLLTKARTYYEGFLAERGDDPAIREEVASIHFRVGLILEQIESADSALEPLQTARRLQHAGLAETSSAARQADLAQTVNAEARVLFRLGRTDEARSAYESSLTLRRELFTQQPSNIEFARRLANTHMNLGIIHKAAGLGQNEPVELQTARDQMIAAQSIRQQIAPADRDIELRRDIGIGHFNLGNLAIAMQDGNASREHFLNAKNAFHELLIDEPDDLDNQYRLVVCLRMLGDDEDDREKADALYSEARGLMESLVLRNPEVHAYRKELARLLLVHGELQIDLEQPDHSGRSLAAAVEQFRYLKKRAPAADVLRGLGMALLHLGEFERSSNAADAIQHLTEAETALTNYLATTPDDSDATSALATASAALAEINERVE